MIPDVTTRAELKAAVDACVGDRLCEMTMPHWDVSRVTDMSFLFQGKTQFNVDISQWEMSQVTDARGMFDGASSFYQDIRGWTLRPRREHDGDVHGRRHLALPCISNGWLRHDGRAAERLVHPASAWRTSACSRAGALHAGLASTTARATTRRSVWTPSATDLGHVMR